MAIDTSGWIKTPGGPNNQGILQWTGGGTAPLLDAGQQSAFRNSLSFGGSGGGGMGGMGGGAGFDFGSLFSSGQEGGGGGLVPYKPGPITGVVNDLLMSAINGSAIAGPGRTLNQMSKGKVPNATMLAFQKNLNRSNADITEKMGAVGNRFGTDLPRILSQASNQANINLSATAMDKAMAAISQIIGLGGGQSAIETTGEQNALDRANAQFLQQQQQNSILPFIEALLNAGGG